MTDRTDGDAPDRAYLDEFGDLDLAIELVRGLNDELGAPDDRLARRLADRFADEQAIDDVRTGCMTLLMFLGATFPEPPLDFIPAAVRKIRRLGVVPEGVLPMIAGGMTAAFLRISPNGWRDAFGPVSHAESLAWVYAAWALVNYVDFCLEEKGAALRHLDDLVNEVLDADG
ncbi:hypothetical protein NE235_28920 [Actinoallomurus spadix]|uniref:Uncharacterized protein n=1 Tax=Actinoallomurus spadix TaxID=79912 RepID=A0ABN0WSZ9_9ACTN|nr:hypothetical protein [Actinoallomurus spadix]MCO5990144.1 hypothetical protein [Actinoallomurus spadix]